MPDNETPDLTGCCKAVILWDGPINDPVELEKLATEAFGALPDDFGFVLARLSQKLAFGEDMLHRAPVNEWRLSVWLREEPPISRINEVFRPIIKKLLPPGTKFHGGVHSKATMASVVQELVDLMMP